MEPVKNHDLQVIDFTLVRPPASRNVAGQYNDLQVPNVSIRPQTPRKGAILDNDAQVLNDLTPPISPLLQSLRTILQSH